MSISIHSVYDLVAYRFSDIGREQSKAIDNRLVAMGVTLGEMSKHLTYLARGIKGGGIYYWDDYPILIFGDVKTLHNEEGFTFVQKVLSIPTDEEKRREKDGG